MKKGMFVILVLISFMVSGVYAGISVSDTSGIKVEGANVPVTKGFSMETSSIIAGNYDVDESTTTTTTKKGRDGAACSDDDECQHVCEGGSCCTDYGDPCDSNSHCCGHPSQGCTNGKCPE